MLCIIIFFHLTPGSESDLTAIEQNIPIFLTKTVNGVLVSADSVSTVSFSAYLIDLFVCVIFILG